MHVYINNSFTPDQEKLLRGSVGPARYFENFLTQEEFNLCRGFFNQPIDWPEHGSVSKYWGFGWDNGLGPQLLWIKEKLNKILPNWELDFFALQEAIQPWKIHADIRWYADKLPYKVLIMPMDVVPKLGPVEPDSWPETYTFSFNQYNFLSASPNTNIGKVGNDQSRWLRSIDMPGVEGIIPGYHINFDTWKKYFTHLKYEDLEGLTIDSINRWRPRSLFWHDSSALHCADNFESQNILTKRCLMVFTKLKH